MDQCGDRPILTALVGWYVHPLGLIWSKVVTLGDAAHYRALGFNVLVDPVKQIDLATWERWQHAIEKAAKRIRPGKGDVEEWRN